MSDTSDKWEERASEYVSRRNQLVGKMGYGPNSKRVNEVEERAANCLTRAKATVK